MFLFALHVSGTRFYMWATPWIMTTHSDQVLSPKLSNTKVVAVNLPSCWLINFNIDSDQPNRIEFYKSSQNYLSLRVIFIWNEMLKSAKGRMFIWTV